MSVAATTAAATGDDIVDGGGGSKMEYSLTAAAASAAGDADGGEQRLQNDWVARSLTSIAPRYDFCTNAYSSTRAPRLQ